MDTTGSNRGLNPSLEEVASGAPRLEDELLAERIENAGLAWLRQGTAPSLAEFVRGVPLLRSRPIALDAAIDVALRGAMARGLTLQAAEAALRGDAPDLGDAIDTHLAVRSMMGSLPREAPAMREAESDLPRPFGPVLKDGRHRYQLEELLGSGAEGTVYRAMDRRLAADGRPLSVAVKMLHGWRDELDRNVSEEAARAMRVRHPAIAALLDHGTFEGQPYLAYDFIDATPLDRWRARQSEVPERSAARLVQELAAAVQVAHNAGVVHRDLKPMNVLIDKGGAPHITDFGLAAAMRRGEGGERVGSLGFAAPEQLRGEEGCEDALVDVYALGGLLYWMLTGGFPNGTSAEDVQRRLRARTVEMSAPDPRVGRPGMDRTLAEICRKALAAEPQHRHQSAAVLGTDLGRWMAREPVAPFDATLARRLRLWMRRAPLTAAGTAVSGMLIVASLAIAWRADLARRQEAFERELEVVLVRDAERVKRMDEARGMVRSYISAMASVRRDAAELSWLPPLSALEALSAKHALDLADLAPEVNTKRIHVAMRVLEDADASGTRDSVEAVIWETTLGFWYLKGHQGAEARPVLEANLERVRRVFPAGDPWTRDVAALLDVAIVTTEADAEVVEAARSRLEAVRHELPVNVERLVSDTLATPTVQLRRPSARASDSTTPFSPP